MVEVGVQKLNDGFQAPLPSYHTLGSAGMDLHANRSVVILPGRREVVPTGLIFEIPEGYEGQIRSRSGLAAEDGIVVLNAPGTIDSDYRGEVRIILFNTSNRLFHIKAGDRIAQLVIAPYIKVELVEVNELTPSIRGSGGFGSTGSK